MADLWSYRTGKRGASVVRVYERKAGGALQVEWYIEGQRYQRSLQYVTGAKVYEKRDAVRIAERMSRRLEQGHNHRVHEVLYGVSPQRTLGDLLARLHAAREKKWSGTYAKDQKRYRMFWVMKLGKDTRLVNVSPAVVEDVVSKNLSHRRPATRNHYRRYLVEAFAYAETKLKWLDPRHNLSAVDYEERDSQGHAYSRDEVPRLLAGLEQVGAVPGWIGHVLWITGRRLAAVRTLPKAAVTLYEDHAEIDFPRETDKARKFGRGVLAGRAFRLTRELMQLPGEYVAGIAPPTHDICCKVWLPAAEEYAGIPHIHRRGWHGLKRRFSTASKGLKGRDKQSGTLESTLRGIYEQDDDTDAKLEVAKELARQVGAL